MARRSIYSLEPASGAQWRAVMSAAALSWLLMVVAPATAGQVYKWVDKHGKVHYGDRPPAAVASEPLEIDKAPVPSPADAARKQKTRRLLDAIDAERQRAQEEAAVAHAEKVRRERNCDAAQRRVAVYERANSVSRTGPDGERVYLSDEQRADALAEARGLARAWCK
jgi:hypothetical protein